MTIAWKVTVDCHSAGALAQFWAAAMGYVPSPPPVGFASWEAWLIHNDVPREEWDDGAAIADPDGAAPGISFLRVPEGKTVKNRLHLDLPVSGGRHLAADVREGRIRAEVERLRGLGASTAAEFDGPGGLDHVVMADPEGNEFCVV